ncbi:MAG: aminoglycoside phosphotransferase family protein [Myxococcales bacterium]|nr:aminoglycoside phosphotransferase family protein [Myxococcales bacterium]MDH3842714.1 aminoglycoside phosphotransferase family protein [Myxococcales bacterium]
MFSTDWDRIVRPLGFPPVERAERLVAGRNSRVHRLEGGSRCVVVKQYFLEGPEPSARQRREYRGLRFLWESGVRAIPEPLWNDFQQGVLVLSFIEGTPAATTSISPGDIDAATDFLVTLRETARRPGARDLDDATDAAFCLVDLTHGIEKRIDRLVREGEAPENLEAPLRELLEGALPVKFAEASHHAKGLLGDQTLGVEARTLSPSDFGFHNALRTKVGLAFVDFEHFGWDDPAKTIADFVLHPGMGIAAELRAAFAKGMLDRFSGFDPGLGERTRLLGPLYAVKWATILLNEFVPAAAARRSFARADTRGDESRLLGQIDKARQMLVRADAFEPLAGL